METLKQVRYYFWASYHRKKLDNLLEKHTSLFRGIVLDIGGRDRGIFQKPKDRVQQWIFADINETHHPDLVLDVSNMESVTDESVDVILAAELFEHVCFPEKGLRECARILKRSGHLILSVPFLSGIHADPFDFQRWTDVKWKKELTDAGFIISTCVVMGTYFTVLSDQIKLFIRALPIPFRWACFLCFPILDLLTICDTTRWIQKQKTLNNSHGGYFIIATK